MDGWEGGRRWVVDMWEGVGGGTEWNGVDGGWVGGGGVVGWWDYVGGWGLAGDGWAASFCGALT